MSNPENISVLLEEDMANISKTPSNKPKGKNLKGSKYSVFGVPPTKLFFKLLKKIWISRFKFLVQAENLTYLLKVKMLESLTKWISN